MQQGDSGAQKDLTADVNELRDDTVDIKKQFDSFADNMVAGAGRIMSMTDSEKIQKAAAAIQSDAQNMKKKNGESVDEIEESVDAAEGLSD